MITNLAVLLFHLALAVVFVALVAFAIACAVIPAWRPWFAVTHEDGSMSVFGSKRAWAIRHEQEVAEAMRRHPAGSAIDRTTW